VTTDRCVSPGCLRRTAAVETPLELKPAPRRPAKPKSKSATVANTVAKQAKLTTVTTKTEKPSAAQTPASAGASGEKAGSSNMMTLQSAPSGKPPTATATTTVGTKIDAPVSGQPSDTSDAVLKKAKVGHVKGKNSSGEEIGARQFLYLVKEEEAYVVSGNPKSVPATAHRNICTNVDSRIRNSRKKQTRE
jgi:hypothetical protein